jgi:hypothetical protein
VLLLLLLLLLLVLLRPTCVSHAADTSRPSHTTRTCPLLMR